ncbi:hypothetical protein ES705_01667 [subsurface metagenome]|nr:hypothetical protein [Clostridia bacterium]
MKAIILTTIKIERLKECLDKKVFGLSEKLLTKLGHKILELENKDLLYIKMKSAKSFIIGPFQITKNKPKINIIKNRGVWFKVSKEHIYSGLPWWIIEGFNWLIFFKYDSRRVKAITEENLKNENILIKDYGIIDGNTEKKLQRFLIRYGIALERLLK